MFFRGKMEIQRLIAATLIALLRRQFPPALIKEQILEGAKIARQLSVEEAIAREAGGEPTNEEAILELATIEATTSYADVVSHTVTKQRTALLEKIEMACKLSTDYSNVTWEITLGDKIKELILPTALTLTFGGLNIRGGKVVKIRAKTATGTAEVWADITGRDVV